MNTDAKTRATTAQVWAWLDEVSDPEIPVISVVDLGIVRNVAWRDDTCVVTITPTYSGCPAMAVIREEIQRALAVHGLTTVSLETQLSPAWTTDWMTPRGKTNLRSYGIAPPAQQVIDISGISRKAQRQPDVVCPHCGSEHTRMVSQFGSTACKALYKCNDCGEPFDYFKCH
jgi:ring-1,2-phenylacetyl-CoA epoxidase subunit PaaD